MTLPKSVTAAVGASEYFEIEVSNGQIILTPVRIQRADAVCAKLAELDLGEQDIIDAVTWARQAVKRSATECKNEQSRQPGGIGYKPDVISAGIPE